MISLLHPSRSRPDRSAQTLLKWIKESSGLEIEIIRSLDADDPALMSYNCFMIGDHPTARMITIINPNNSSVEAINQAAKVATGDYMIVVSDDTDCPKNWGAHIEYELRKQKDFVLRVDDGVHDWLITMPILDRRYYDRFGYVYYPGYSHLFCDTEFTHVATCLGKVCRIGIQFRHLQYSVLRERPDELNLRNNATWDQGKALYLERFKGKFGLDIDPWKINSESHLKWLKYNLNGTV